MGQLIEIIIVPLVVAGIVYLIRTMTNEAPPSNEEAVDFAIDCAAIGTVACGSVFANNHIQERWHDWATLTVTVAVLFCIGLMAWLGKIRRWDNGLPIHPCKKYPGGKAAWAVTDHDAARNFVIGFVPIVLDIVLLSVGYLWPK